MKMMRRNRVLVVLCGMFLGLCGVLCDATPAAAHATIVDSDPAADSVVSQAPEIVSVEFNEAVTMVAADTKVVGPDGEVASRKATAKNDTVTYRLGDDLPKGTYLVSYRVTSADGHPVPGGFTFSIGKQTQTPAAAEEFQADSWVTALVMVNRYLGYLGFAAACGAGLLLLSLPGLPQRHPRHMLTIGLSTVAMTAILGLYLQAPYTAGSSLGSVTGPDIGAVLASRFGGASLLRMLFVLVAVPLLYQALRQPSRLMRIGAGCGVLVVAATWPFSGHATTSAAPPLTMLTGTVHVATAAMWVGGLCAVALFALRPAWATEAEAFLPAWSRWATWLVSGLAVAGLAQALVHIASVDALVSTSYGWLVIAKVAVFAVLLGIAALARARVRRGARQLVTRVRRLVGVEVGLGLAVIGISAVLVQAVPAATEAGQQAPESSSQTQNRVLEGERFTLEFEIEPSTVGENTVHLYCFEPDGTSQFEPREWEATYQQPHGDLEPIELELEEVSPYHRIAEASLPRAGKWSFNFTIRTSKFNQETVDTVVSVN